MHAWKWCSLIAVLVFILTGLPPVSTVVQRMMDEHWVISSMISLQRMLIGAHSSILVTESCQLGIFDAIHELSSKSSCPVPSATAEAGNTVESSSIVHWIISTVACFFESSSECAVVKDIARLCHVRDERRIRILLRALEGLGLVHSCSQVEDGFINARHTERFLVRQLRSGIPNDDFVCGMGLVANDRLVIERLLDISSQWRADDDAEEITMQAQDDAAGVTTLLRLQQGDFEEDDSWLWSQFAEHSAEFTRATARHVARRVVGDVLGLCSGPSSSGSLCGEVALADIGCGSGEYLRELVSAVQSSSTATRIRAIYVDLPGAIAECRSHHNRWSLHSSASLETSFSFLEGSIFLPEVLEQLARDLSTSHCQEGSVPTTATIYPQNSTVVVMMNSFLQHLSQSESTSVIRSVFRTVKPSPVTLVLTELVVPEGSYCPWTELTPMARTFSAVLSSITERGEVRTMGQYVALAAAAGCAMVSNYPLFPMPAVVLVFRCTD